MYSVDAELVGMYSPTEEHRTRFARDNQLPALDSAEAVIHAAEVVHVCTPPATHEALTVQALSAEKSAVVEKPLTGHFPQGSYDPDESFSGAMESVGRIVEAERTGGGRVLYAENWIYAPAIQKEREVIEKTGAQILWLHGEESHSGSHSEYYGYRRFSGGGSLIGKGCHPLSTALYLKRVEGRGRTGSPIRPVAVSGRCHRITASNHFVDAGHLRSDYHDVEDFSSLHVVFEDDTVADVFASELILGGIHNWLEVAANNHRTLCNINPNNAMQTYNPNASYFQDINVVEKIGTKEGWAFTSPDEDWFAGYQHEAEAFYRAIAFGEELESDLPLAADSIACIYAGYVSAAQNGAEVRVPHV
jgi:predicted dehydrogenase